MTAAAPYRSRAALDALAFPRTNPDGHWVVPPDDFARILATACAYFDAPTPPPAVKSNSVSESEINRATSLLVDKWGNGPGYRQVERALRDFLARRAPPALPPASEPAPDNERCPRHGIPLERDHPTSGRVYLFCPQCSYSRFVS